MKIAYIIVAHKQPLQVARLVLRLNAAETSFFIHVDRKTPDATYRGFVSLLEGLPNVCFLKRHVCNWGEFGLIRAPLEGIAEICRRGESPDYVVLLSGQDYPIKTNGFIHAFFERSGGRSYINYDAVPSEGWRNAAPRIKRWQVRLLGRPVEFPQRKVGLAALRRPRKWPVVFISYFLPEERRFPVGYKPFTGSAFWAMTGKCVRLVDGFVRANPAFVRFFKYVMCPDEIFFQTVLLNSEIAGEMVDSDLHCIDWSQRGPHPATFTAKDLERLATSPALFARKFDLDLDETILQLIDERLLGISPASAPGTRSRARAACRAHTEEAE